VSPDNAREIVREFSTPSGHAMAAAAAYGYLGWLSRRRAVVFFLIVIIALVGASRPYLGVHYVEDILLGWAIGGALAFGAYTFGAPIIARWSMLSIATRAFFCLAASVLVWITTLAPMDWRFGQAPDAFVAYLGFLSGVVVAVPLEQRFIDFDPRAGGLGARAGRWLCCAIGVIASMYGLKMLMAPLAAMGPIIADGLDYLRYFLVAIVGLFGAPAFFNRLGLGRRPGAV
jgi:hypothetical protein